MAPHRSSDAQRAHLGGRAEHDHGAALEAQPLGVVEHRADRLAQGRLDDAVGHPGVELAPQVVAAEPVTAVGDRERRLGLTLTAERLGREQVGGAARDPAERRLESDLTTVGVAPAHPVVDRGETRVGDGDGILGSRQPRLDESAEVGEVAAAPVRLALGGGRPDGVDGSERVGDDAPAGGAGRATPVDLGEDDAGRLGGRSRHSTQPQTSARDGSARIAATSAR